MRKALIAGNWKMFKTEGEAVLFAEELAPRVADVEDREILVCPPYVYIYPLIHALVGSTVMVGAQNVFWEDQGAFTGEVSAPMIRSTGARFAIVGHSERRQYFSETDESVNRRLTACLKATIAPIVCVGESLQEREAGKTLDVVGSQLRVGLKNVPSHETAHLVIAYEPVWAIGTGRTATPQIAQEVHAFIRGVLRELFGESPAEAVRILYGGSVKPDNVDDLMAQEDIDGALVGGASLDVTSFERIIRYRG
ncbi:MAG TPA: triose-phosphate isomerase [Deltaproteobacteria bacterium]|jgi:triosephosphate isomerase|nr:triose-phosphate isomerase [Deltaproteobacteria bacterium]OQC28054.1 MAG: Bifunctional PGK [Deltaproteobacteria bacterium ADurb.Bin072]HRW79495.1 triose-phosphate isomerase [Desulfomonilia bacterium]NMD41528.1 triose-phosphate isomerase [Deltaproteobacteria bacterium]HNQ85276.1 triose-phosphate isomerase [Deltaproteobacteria bacterium]